MSADGAQAVPDGALYCDVIVQRWEKFTGGKAEQVAEQSNDKAQLKLLEETTRYRTYRFSDRQLPAMMPHVMGLIYLSEQLEHGTMCLLSL
ncbi:MAG TPA: hypothetical protein VG900_03115 [Hyphomicrobiaceae bacterium]|nr:hypothetical protein [Hyphomicrobiaceae bacterium]